MAVLPIRVAGDPVLRQKAKKVRKIDASIQKLIDDMIETMRDERGVGLAAPQIHEPLRLFIMDPGRSEGGEDGLKVVVNPELTFPDEERMELWEGCLSIPGIRGLTERRATVEVRCLDREGRPHACTLHGFPAAVAQHETDHLDGVLFLQRMPDVAALAFEDEFARFLAPAERGDDAGEAADA